MVPPPVIADPILTPVRSRASIIRHIRVSSKMANSQGDEKPMLIVSIPIGREGGLTATETPSSQKRGNFEETDIVGDAARGGS